MRQILHDNLRIGGRVRNWTRFGQDHSGAGISGDEVGDLLTSLTEKSLIAVDETGRYRLLESIREYGRAMLKQCGEAEVICDRHLRCFLALAEEAEPHLTGGDQQGWLARLEAEHDNLRAALEWSQESPGTDEGLRLAGALWRFWYVRGYIGEGRARLHDLMAAETTTKSLAANASVLNGAGVLAWHQGDYPSARALYEESLAMRRELGDRKGISISLNNLGALAFRLTEYAFARTCFEESLAIRRELGDRHGIAYSLNNLGNLAHDQRDYQAARTLYEESLAICREVGDLGAIALSLNNLAMATIEQGDYAHAQALLEEGVSIKREVGDRLGIAQLQTNLGCIAFQMGAYAAAQALHEDSLAIYCEMGAREGIAHSLDGLAEVAGRTFPDRAPRLWGAAERLREEIGVPLPQNERSRYDRQVAAARAALDEKAQMLFDRAWQEGRGMTLEQVLALALTQTAALP